MTTTEPYLLVHNLYFFDENDKPKPASELQEYLLKTRVLVAINYIKEQLEDPTIDQPIPMTLRVREARHVVQFLKQAGLEVEEALEGLPSVGFAEIKVHPPGGLPDYVYTPDEPEPVTE